MDFKFESIDEDFRSEIKDFVEKELPWNWKEQDLDPASCQPYEASGIQRGDGL